MNDDGSNRLGRQGSADTRTPPTPPTSGGGAADDDASISKDSNVQANSADCPHVQRDDCRCSHRFSLGRMEQALSVCFGTFHACPIFHRINGEGRAAAPTAAGGNDRARPLITVTIHENMLPLRATGT